MFFSRSTSRRFHDNSNRNPVSPSLAHALTHFRSMHSVIHQSGGACSCITPAEAGCYFWAKAHVCSQARRLRTQANMVVRNDSNTHTRRVPGWPRGASMDIIIKCVLEPRERHDLSFSETRFQRTVHSWIQHQLPHWNFVITAKQTFRVPSRPLRSYRHSGVRASHYAVPTTLALSLLVTDRPAIVPATEQRALTLSSLAGRLPVSASSRNTRRLGSTESTCRRRRRSARHPWNPAPEARRHCLAATEGKYTERYSRNWTTDLDVDSRCLKCDFDSNQKTAWPQLSWCNDGIVLI